MQLTTELLESFALGEQREQALAQLIPGTEEHFFLSCLHLQQQGRLGEVEPLLSAWVDRHGRTQALEQMRDRQALLRWGEDPQGTVDRLRERLGPYLSHARDVEDEAPRWPTRLDPALLDRTRLLRQVLEGNHHLSPFDPRADGWLVRQRLSGDKRRELLDRLDRPDHEGLVGLIVEDLKHPHSRGFGSLRAHRVLTLAQLEELAEREPGLRHDPRWVEARLVRLQPGPDEPWEVDPAAREAWLERLERAVDPLPPAFNSLKAQVLYQRLDHDRSRGVFDQERLRRYLELPRQASWARREWWDRRDRREHLVDLSQDHRRATLFPPPGDDAGLVREHLEQHLARSDSWHPWEHVVREDWLREVWAEAQLLVGQGELERSAALLSSGALTALRERVELRLLPWNPTLLGGEDPVRLEVELKHVPTLVVKVYELNPLGWFQTHGSELPATIDLDGLVPTWETTLQQDAPPWRRVRRSLELPGLDRPGLFAVELIGNGLSSRALLRKGTLRALERRSAAGHAFSVVDEAGRPCPQARLWLQGREHLADEAGEVRVPYTTSPGPRTALLLAGERAATVRFQHLGELYSFAAAIHVEREALLRRTSARVLVRPALGLHGVPLPLQLIEQPRLVIESTDRHGVSSTREVGGLRLQDERETEVTLQVPEDLARVSFTLRGEVKQVSAGQTQQVSAGRSFELNGIDQTPHLEALHLRRSAEGWTLLLLGKNGEERANVPLDVRLSHRDLSQALQHTLATDAAGRVELGNLPGVHHVSAQAPSGVQGSWDLTQGQGASWPRLLQARAGETLAVCWPGDPAGEPAREEVSFLGQRRGEGWVEDLFGHLSLADGLLRLRDLPAGDHQLRLHGPGVTIDVRVGTGPRAAGWVTGPRRQLEAPEVAPLQLLPLEVRADSLHLRLENAGPATRVHLFALRLLPPWSALTGLGAPPPAAPRGEGVPAPVSQYMSGRALGDEVRYVLERRYAARRPGNLLPRPGLLLNPWAVRGTDTAGEVLRGGGAYAPPPPPPCAAPAQAYATLGEPWAGGAGGEFPNLDFLRGGAPLLSDLRPDARGQLTIPRDALGDAVLVRAVAVDGSQSVGREACLPERPWAREELRLRRGLDPDRPAAVRRAVTPLLAGQALEVEDLASTKLEVLDSLTGALRLLGTLLGDARLDRFAWLVRWPELSEAEQRAKYSEHAGHEVNLFLRRKDPQFFARVIAPYLRNRRDKTLVDLWLLDEDLSAFLEPWRLGRLNAVERALLALARPDLRPALVRRLDEELSLDRPDPEEEERRFKTALGGRALDSDDAYGLREATRSAALAFDEVADMCAEEEEAMPMAKKASSESRRAAPKKRAKRAERSMDDMDDADEEAYGEVASEPPGAGGAAPRDMAAREQQAPRWRQLDKTQELAERSWWEVPRPGEGPALIPPGRLWRDLAAHEGGPFLSPHLVGATRSLSEVLCALAFLDLPFAAQAPETRIEGARLRLQARTPCLVFHEQVGPAPKAAEPLPILVNQSYLDHAERWVHDEDGTSRERYLGHELLVQRAYVCQVALTNPTSTPRRLELLLQVPRGAIPLENGFWTRGVHVELGGFATETVEYAFYFPAPGTQPHAPVQVSYRGEVVAAAQPASLEVLLRPSTVDTTSWAWVSQRAELPQLEEFLGRANLARLDLDKIAWRLRDKEPFRRLTALLAGRMVYQDALWAYALVHRDAQRLGEWLRHQEHFLDGCGPCLRSPLVEVDPVLRGRYEQLEYAPLVNARAHALAGQPRIRNRSLLAQWDRWLTVLCHRPGLGDEEWLATAVYLLLQDRVDEALAALGRVDPLRVQEQLQLDYLRAAAAFYGERPEAARELAARWREHPVDRWRDLFRGVLAQLDEAAGAEVQLDPEAKDRDRRQEGLAAREAAFDLLVEGRVVRVEHQNVSELEVRWYLMDVELLFSRQPFVQEQGGGAFASVRPNRRETLRTERPTGTLTLALPPELQGKNALVEVAAGGAVQARAVYAHSLALQVIERWGQLAVRHQETRAPLPGTYVKAYARMRGGEVKFYRDGYTDLRGRFDYASLSTDDLERVERFALLVLHDRHGAVIREAAPPIR